MQEVNTLPPESKESVSKNPPRKVRPFLTLILLVAIGVLVIVLIQQQRQNTLPEFTETWPGYQHLGSDNPVHKIMYDVYTINEDSSRFDFCVVLDDHSRHTAYGLSKKRFMYTYNYYLHRSSMFDKDKHTFIDSTKAHFIDKN